MESDDSISCTPDLGLVDYVFSDKTGTLTSNEMQLRLLAIKGSSYGQPDFK